MLLVAGESVKTCGRQGVISLMVPSRVGRVGLVAWLCERARGWTGGRGAGLLLCSVWTPGTAG